MRNDIVASFVNRVARWIVTTVWGVAIVLVGMGNSSTAFGAESGSGNAGVLGGDAHEHHGLVSGEIISAGIGGVDGKGGMYRVGAWVPVRVRLENRSGKEFVGRLAVEQPDLDGDKVLSLGQKVILEPGDVDGRDVWLYYWPRPDDEMMGVRQVLVMDETGGSVVATIRAKADTSENGNAIGLGRRDDSSGRSARWVVLLGNSTAGFGAYIDSLGGTETVRFATVPDVKSLPDNAMGLDGVDTVVWEAEKIHPSDLPADFQLKALLGWVRSGGHLVISVATQGDEFQKGEAALRDAMPMDFEGTRPIKTADLREVPGVFGVVGDEAPLTQVIGTIRTGGRAVGGTSAGIFGEHPLAVTRMYGQGTVTVITVDVTQGPISRDLSDHQWMVFWNQLAGWQGSDAEILTRKEFELTQKTKNGSEAPAEATIQTLSLGGSEIADAIDVTEVTQVRVLVAVLFLIVYWLAAGPVGHLVLRTYKVIHWSWWVFGGTVVVAAGVAWGVVSLLAVTSYDVRHVSTVLGTVNSDQEVVESYYGVFAPASGQLSVKQPSTDGNGVDISYLTPLAFPTTETVKPFADPQGYTLNVEQPSEVTPVFRDTLKKIEGRWSGHLKGITGDAKAGENFRNPLVGSLTNSSGYDLSHVEFIVHFPPIGRLGGQGTSYLYRVEDWKAGVAIDLSKALMLEQTPSGIPIRLEEMLRWLGRKYSSSTLSNFTDSGMTPDEQAAVSGRDMDSLYVLLNARQTDGIFGGTRIEPERTVWRAADRAAALYASGAMIIAKAGSVKDKAYVPTPILLVVNGHDVPGRGEIHFAWALPMQGKISEAPMVPGFRSDNGQNLGPKFPKGSHK